MCNRDYFFLMKTRMEKRAEGLSVLHSVYKQPLKYLPETRVPFAHLGIDAFCSSKTYYWPPYLRISQIWIFFEKMMILTVPLGTNFWGEPYEQLSKWRTQILKEANTNREQDPLVPNAVLEGVAQQWQTVWQKKTCGVFPMEMKFWKTVEKPVSTNTHEEMVLLVLVPLASFLGLFFERALDWEK